MYRLAIALTFAATTIQAQDAQDRVSSTSPTLFSIDFNAGLGVQSAPSYLGSSANITGATGSFALDELYLFGTCFGCGEKSGFGVTGAFNYIGARDAADTFDAIDAAIELGGGLSYTSDTIEASAVIRRGFGGHEGYVAALSADYIVGVSDAVTVKVGPRLLAADDTFNDTYFSTSDGTFTAAQGLVSRGVELSASYAFDETWGVTATARYDQLLQDAAASPISESDDQTTISLIVTRNFNW